MKWFLIFWAGPLAFLGGWYWLSYNDISFGTFILSRQAHDLIFAIYGKVLGVPAADVPLMIAKALVVDSLFVVGLFAFRKRAKVIAWVQTRREAHASLRNEESLSSAP
jgi:hypothetical protein